MNNIKAFIYKDMKRNATFKVLLMFIVGLFLSVNTFAQQIVVKGIVKDTTGEPIIGANVIVKGTTNGTITDFDGNFLLNANYKPQNKMFHFCKTFCSKITLVNTIQNVI